MKKPLNIAFETLSYAASLLLLLAARRSSMLEGYVTKIWDYWVGAYFFAMVLLITARAARKKAEDRAVVSAFTFGFLSGVFLWSMYIINESRSEGLTLHAYVLIYILLFGCLAGGAAALCAYIARSIFRTVWGSGVGS
jgi:apolipoprotein N-acyltransferase